MSQVELYKEKVRDDGLVYVWVVRGDVISARYYCPCSPNKELTKFDGYGHVECKHCGKKWETNHMGNAV